MSLMYIDMFAINFLTSNKSLWMPRSRLVTKTDGAKNRKQEQTCTDIPFCIRMHSTNWCDPQAIRDILVYLIFFFRLKRTGIYFVIGFIAARPIVFHFIYFTSDIHSPVPLQLSLQFSSAIQTKSKWLGKKQKFILSSHLSLSKISTLVLISVSDSFSPFA